MVAWRDDWKWRGHSALDFWSRYTTLSFILNLKVDENVLAIAALRQRSNFHWGSSFLTSFNKSTTWSSFPKIFELTVRDYMWSWLETLEHRMSLWGSDVSWEEAVTDPAVIDAAEIEQRSLWNVPMQVHRWRPVYQLRPLSAASQAGTARSIHCALIRWVVPIFKQRGGRLARGMVYGNVSWWRSRTAPHWGASLPSCQKEWSVNPAFVSLRGLHGMLHGQCILPVLYGMVLWLLHVWMCGVRAGMELNELLDIPQGDRRKYHDDVSVMVISLEGRIWRSSGSLKQSSNWAAFHFFFASREREWVSWAPWAHSNLLFL